MNESLYTTQERKESMYKYDAIVVLGAVMEWNEKKHHWEFPTVIEKYAGKLVMGKARALAAREIEHLAPILLVTGGSDENPDTHQRDSRSVELSKLMTDRYHVPKYKVVSMGTTEASHTLGNVENVIKYIDSHPEIVQQRKVAILSPRFQLERAKLMFEDNSYFHDNNLELEWLVVEDILEEKDERYKKWSDSVYNLPEAKINRALEVKGIEDFKSGKYNTKS